MTFSIPTSRSVGMTQNVLETLESHVKNINQIANAGTVAANGKADFEERVMTQATPRQFVVAWAVASVGTFLFATLDIAANVALAAIKAPFVLVNETIGRLTNLHKFTPDAIKGEDFLGHLANCRRCLLIGINAAAVFFMPQSPEMVLTVARKIKLLHANDGTRISANQAQADAQVAARAQEVAPEAANPPVEDTQEAAKLTTHV